MNALTAHRGPDGVGIYANDTVTFGHNRLAIIDLSELASQPMCSPDGKLMITYNGELYNYRELRRELAGYQFRSESDTEVILAAYAQWGTECLKRFNGIFAFALWDERRKCVVLARDQMGVKPLYYSVKDGAVLFSSEIKALLEAGVGRKLNLEAFSRFMRISDVVGPQTLFSEVHRLPPAHYAVVQNASVKLVRYWDGSRGEAHYKPDAVWHRSIRETLDASVARQLVSDRPVGVFLSGGIDSSAVLASVVRAAGPARTYTTRFEVHTATDDEKFNRDADLAQRTASILGCSHTEVIVSTNDIIPLFEDSVWYLDEPSGSATALAQLALARQTVRDVAVVLGGDGGDELFGGYDRYRLSRIMDLYQRLPSRLRDAAGVHPSFAKLNTPPGVSRFALFHFMKQPYLERVLAKPFQADYATEYCGNFFSDPEVPFLEALLDADRRMLADGSLLRTDKLSMAAGLEARVPLLDKEMVELAARIPAAQKVSMTTTKRLFKEAVREQLPDYLFQEQKRGWFAPAGLWLQQPAIFAYAKEVLSASYYAPTSVLFDWDGVGALLEEHYGRRASHRTFIWTLLSFQLWAQRFRVTL